MSRRKIHLPFVLSTLWLIGSWTPFLSFAAVQTQPGDTGEILAVAERFFAAFQRKDVSESMSLWSESSPGLAAARQTLQHMVDTVDSVEIKRLTFGNVELAGDRATLPVVAEISATDRKTGKPAEGFGRLNRTLYFVREGAVWKVWRYTSGEEDLAARIVESKTVQERRALLNANQQLVTPELGKALLAQAAQLHERSANTEALSIFELAADVATGLNDRLTISGALRGQGIVHFRQGRYEQAIEYYEKALRISTEIDDKAGIASTLNDIAVVERGRGEFSKALEHYQRTLEISEEIGDKVLVCKVLSNIGLTEDQRGNYDEALEDYQKALKISNATGDKLEACIVLNNIGRIDVQQGNYFEGLTQYQKAFEISEELGWKPAMAGTLNNIGEVHYRQGNYPQALEHLQKSLAIREEIGDRQGIAESFANIGMVRLQEGNYPQALEYNQKGLELMEQIGDKVGIADALNNIGLIECQQEAFPEALDYYLRSLKISQEIGNKAGVAESLVNIGVTYNLEAKYREGIETGERAVALARQLQDLDLMARALSVLGRAYQATGSLERARDALAEATAAVEQVRNQAAGSEQDRQRLLENRVMPYYAMADLLIDQQNPSKALAFSERAKARTLIEVLESGRVNITKAMTVEERDNESNLRSQLASLNAQIVDEKVREHPNQDRLDALNTQLEEARLRYEAFQTTLYATHPELKAQRGRFQPITLQECAGLVPGSDGVLIEFLVSDDRTDVFVLTGTKGRKDTPDLKAYKILIKRRQLAGLVGTLRQQLSNQDLGYAELARKLYSLLLGPATAEIGRGSSLIIVPDGPLWDLPFQALQPASRRFLVQDHSVSYAPSLTALREMSSATADRRPKGSQINALVAFGNPTLSNETRSGVKQLMGEELAPLPAMEKMVRELGALYGPGSKIFVNGDATKDRLKAEAGDCSILDVATHGIVNNASPMYSQIFLARAKNSPEGGVLEAWEVMHMDLKASLVVLSACETARGRVSAGEGMIGLSWAFFVAGCPTTVASQWKVESEATALLMLEFHRNLLAHMSKSDALRKAELKLLRTKRYSDPFYWAGFVIVGDAR